MVLLKNILQGELQLPAVGGDYSAQQDAQKLFVSSARALHRTGVEESEEVYPIWVPGRIEVLGKHTDYAGGKSLLAALSKGFAFLVHANKSSQLHVLDAESDQRIQVDLTNPNHSTSYPWGVYLQTVVERAKLNFGPLSGGATVSMSSNIPRASGMSSSSALVTGLFLSINAACRLDTHPMYKENILSGFDLSDYLGHVENGQSYRGLPGERGVGTFGGSQDHTAILCSRAGVLRLFSFQPTRFLEDVRLPEGYCFVIGCSGVRAEKTRSALNLYNRCAILVQQILACPEVNPGKRHNSLGEMIAERGFTYAEVCNLLDSCGASEELYRRLYQFMQETNEIIPGVVTAFRNNDLDSIGRLIDRSQELANTHLGNQVRETNYLAFSARSMGAAASSAFGAGFGGSVWALVEKTDAPSFRRNWQEAYFEKYPQWKGSACFFVEYTGDGVYDGTK